MSCALVVLSGGQDSTTCLYWAKKHFDKVRALTFCYGQRHIREVEIAKELAEEADVPWESMDISFISQLSPSCSLTNLELNIEEEKREGDPYPTTFVPGRNLFFLSIAAIYARNHGIYDIVTGVGQADYSGYPDCHDSFVKSLNATLNLAMDEQFRLHTPLMWLDKMQIWALADELGVIDTIRKNTLTCYNGIMGDGCGHCPACKLRREGYQKYINSKE